MKTASSLPQKYRPEHPVDRLLVIYATWHGQAKLIARRIAEAAAESGMTVTVQDVGESSATDLAQNDNAVIVASIQFGRHRRSMTRFVKANRDRLNAMRTAFVSVSGDAVAATTRPRAEKYAADFLRITGWTPAERLLAGGAARLTQYNPLLRFMIRRVFAAKGMALDPRRDYDYTDWEAVTRFARAFATGGRRHVA